MHKRKLSALGKCLVHRFGYLHTHLYLHTRREMLWQKSGIYSAESFNSQQSESFDIKWLTYVFCITVNISFNVYVHRLHKFIFMESILYFKCRCHVCVPFISPKLFPNKYLGIQKQ